MALVPGREYPNTYRGFVKMFPDNTACAAFLIWLRWPEGFICPACKTSSIPWNESRGRLACPNCRHQISVSAGTIFDKMRTPLMTWFEVAWQCGCARWGFSALTRDQLFLTTCNPIWKSLHSGSIDAILEIVVLCSDGFLNRRSSLDRLLRTGRCDIWLRLG